MKQKIFTVMDTAITFLVLVIVVDLLFSFLGYEKPFLEDSPNEFYKKIFIYSSIGLALGIEKLFGRNKIDKQ